MTAPILNLTSFNRSILQKMEKSTSPSNQPDRIAHAACLTLMRCVSAFAKSKGSPSFTLKLWEYQEQRDGHAASIADVGSLVDLLENDKGGH